MVLLAIVLVVFFAQQAEPEITLDFMKSDVAIVQTGEYYRLITAMFLHGSLAHLFFNAYALYAIGATVERLFGSVRFSIIYLLGGLSGSVASLIFTPAPSVGASAAIFALLGAEAVFFFVHRDLFGVTGRRRLGNLVFVAVVNLLLGAASPMIDNWGHVGGLFGGVVLAWFIGPRLRLHVEPWVGVTPRVVDDNPLQRTWPAALLFVGGLMAALVYVVLSWG
jgi:rhomboid protease GluP